ncbi:unnamed protein product [Gongylonema pulchrum]|uniref:Uncharacterized protein n=1 Tax=Gongylonema pulchrum TaxID=637853 RepID=A0A183EUF3_9BILA|nr:unnamed protein product [Gongylonema pulchrum]
MVLRKMLQDRYYGILLRPSTSIFTMPRLRILERNGEAPYAESIFNYHLSDRSVRLFLPGMSRPQL